MQNKDYFTDLFNKMNKNTQQNIKTSYIGQIVKLTLPTCSVQPLAMINGNKLPMVEDVNFITIPLQYKIKMDFDNDLPFTDQIPFHQTINYTDTVPDGKSSYQNTRSTEFDHNIEINKNFHIKHQMQIVDKKLNYKTGDIVLVNILDLDNSYFQNKGKFNVGSTRRHSMDYSVIVGKIADKNDFKFKN